MTFGVILAARIIQFVTMAAGVKIMTSLLGPHELGVLSLLTSITGLIALALVNPAGTYINRHLHGWVESGAFYATFTWLIRYLMVVAVFGALVFIGVQSQVDSLQQTPLLYGMILICGSLIFNSIVQTLVPSLNLLGKTLIWAVLTVCAAVATLFLSTAFVVFFGETAVCWLAGALISHITFSAIAFKLFFSQFPSIRTQQAPFKFQDVGFFSVPVAFWLICTWMQFQGYRIYFADQVGLTELGLFFAGYSLAAWVMGAVDMTVSARYQPDMYRECVSAEVKTASFAWGRYIDNVLPYYIATCFAVIILSDELAAILLAPEYKSVAVFVTAGAVAELARVWLGNLNLLFQLELNTRKMVLPMVLGCLAVVLGSILLVPKYGITAAPYMASFGAFMITIYVLWIIRFDTQRPIFSMPKVAGLSLLATAPGWAFVHFRDVVSNDSSLLHSVINVCGFATLATAVFLIRAVWAKT